MLNPYQYLPIYNNERAQLHSGKRRSEVPPHVYAVADESYRELLLSWTSQAIVLTGESLSPRRRYTSLALLCTVYCVLYCVLSPRRRYTSLALLCTVYCVLCTVY